MISYVSLPGSAKIHPKSTILFRDQYFQTLLSKYREPVTHETCRYPPFIELANHVINRLNTNPDSRICFCRNDPVIVEGSHADRKPDVVVVRYKSLEVPEREFC